MAKTPSGHVISGGQTSFDFLQLCRIYTETCAVRLVVDSRAVIPKGEANEVALMKVCAICEHIPSFVVSCLL